jgi:hypothetical protein
MGFLPIISPGSEGTACAFPRARFGRAPFHFRRPVRSHTWITVCKRSIGSGLTNNVLANCDTAANWSQRNFYNESIVSGDDYNAVLNAYVAAARGAKGLEPAVTRATMSAPLNRQVPGCWGWADWR